MAALSGSFSFWENMARDTHHGTFPVIKIEEHFDENGEWHCIGGPALAFSNGGMCWYRHGKCHRRGGPASIYAKGDKLWYVNGRQLPAPKKLPERAHGLMELFL